MMLIFLVNYSYRSSLKLIFYLIIANIIIKKSIQFKVSFMY